ncbi:MAG: hypothetical protein F7C36_03805 [Desulfurococcales archaeon]|nr:hypothetical protein [Desulfurococcales archaeon]
MDPKLLAIIAVIVVGGIAAAIFIGGGGETTPSNETTGQDTTTTASTTTVQGGEETSTTADLEGTWQGTYTSSYGPGTWQWVIKETSPGHYEGCLMTSGPYETTDWLPMTVTVEGNEITLGSVGLVQVVFTGTVSGDSAQGDWHIMGGSDQGTWQGSKVNSDNTLPCLNEEQTSTTTSSMETTTTTQEYTTTTETTTTTFNGNLGCWPPPSDVIVDAYTSLNLALAEIYGADNLSCISVSGSGTLTYLYVVSIEGFNPNTYQQDLNNLMTAMNSHGWIDLAGYNPMPYVAGITGNYISGNYVINVTMAFYITQSPATVQIALTASIPTTTSP